MAGDLQRLSIRERLSAPVRPGAQTARRGLIAFLDENRESCYKS